MMSFHEWLKNGMPESLDNKKDMRLNKATIMVEVPDYGD